MASNMTPQGSDQTLAICLSNGPKRLGGGMLSACWAVLLVMVVMVGCDLPDRHDIAMFRKQAPWEVDRDQAPTEIAAEEALQVGPADAFDRWQWWRLE